MADKKKIAKLKPFDEKKYSNVDLDRLILYSVKQLSDIGVELSFENIVVAVFYLFPRKFSLLGYSEYPDSNRAKQSLWRCVSKSKQWLGGHFTQGFVITDRTKIFIKEAEKLLQNVSLQNKRATSQTRRKESLLKEVISSSAYQKYLKKQSESITDAEFCFLLQGTLDSSIEILRNNFNLFKELSEELGHKELAEFFKFLATRFKKFLINGLK